MDGNLRWRKILFQRKKVIFCGTCKDCRGLVAFRFVFFYFIFLSKHFQSSNYKSREIIMNTSNNWQFHEIFDKQTMKNCSFLVHFISYQTKWMSEILFQDDGGYEKQICQEKANIAGKKNEKKCTYFHLLILFFLKISSTCHEQK